MEVLTQCLHRLRFYWQQSIFSQRWVIILMLLAMMLSVLTLKVWLSNQQLESTLQQLPEPTRHVEVNRSTDTTSSPLQTWPTEEEAERISAEILAEADVIGMQFERAEFQSLSVEHSSLQIQRIKLPMKGEYLQLRQFLHQVLTRYPSLAVSQFKLQRGDVTQSTIEAYVEFSLYTRKRGES